jgi:hypothetical protein
MDTFRFKSLEEIEDVEKKLMDEDDEDGFGDADAEDIFDKLL